MKHRLRPLATFTVIMLIIQTVFAGFVFAGQNGVAELPGQETASAAPELATADAISPATPPPSSAPAIIEQDDPAPGGGISAEGGATVSGGGIVPEPPAEGELPPEGKEIAPLAATPTMSAIQLPNKDIQITLTADNATEILTEERDGVKTFSLDLYREDIGYEWGFYGRYIDYYLRISGNQITIPYSTVIDGWWEGFPPGPFDIILSSALLQNEEKNLRTQVQTTGSDQPPANVDFTVRENGDIALTTADSLWLKQVFNVSFYKAEDEERSFDFSRDGGEGGSSFYLENGQLVIPYSAILNHSGENEMTPGSYRAKIYAFGYFPYQPDGTVLTTTRQIRHVPPPAITVTQTPEGDLRISKTDDSVDVQNWWRRLTYINCVDAVSGEQKMEYSLGTSEATTPGITRSENDIFISRVVVYSDHWKVQQGGNVRFSFSCYNLPGAQVYYEPYTTAVFALESLPTLPIAITATFVFDTLRIVGKTQADREALRAYYSFIQGVNFSSKDGNNWVYNSAIPKAEWMNYDSSTGQITLSRQTLLAHNIYSGDYYIWISPGITEAPHSYYPDRGYGITLNTVGLSPVPPGIDIHLTPAGDLAVTAPGAAGRQWISKIIALYPEFNPSWGDSGFYAGDSGGHWSNDIYHAFETYGNTLLVPKELMELRYGRNPPRELNIMIRALGYEAYSHPDKILYGRQGEGTLPERVVFQQQDNGDLLLRAMGGDAAEWISNITEISVDQDYPRENPYLTGIPVDAYVRNGSTLTIPYAFVGELGLTAGNPYPYLIRSQGFPALHSLSLEEGVEITKFLTLTKSDKRPPTDVFVSMDTDRNLRIFSENGDWLSALYEISLVDGWTKVEYPIRYGDFSRSGNWITVSRAKLAECGIIDTDGFSYTATVRAAGYLPYHGSQSLLINPDGDGDSPLKQPPDSISVGYVRGQGLVFSAEGAAGADWLSRINYIQLYGGDSYWMQVLARNIPFVDGKRVLTEEMMKTLQIPQGATLDVSVLAAGYQSKDLRIPVGGTVALTSIDLTTAAGSVAVGGLASVTASIVPVGEEADLRWLVGGVYRPDDNGKSTIYLTQTTAGTVTACAISARNPSVRSNAVSITFAGPAVPPLSALSFPVPTQTIGTRGGTLRVLPTAVGGNETYGWLSSDETVARVGPDGTVTAVDYGTAEITAFAPGSVPGTTLTASYQLRVKPHVPVIALKLTASADTLERGQSQRITPTVTPENASDKSLRWTSLQPDIATVDADGNVTGRGHGLAVIVARTADGSDIRATCTISVFIPGAPRLPLLPGQDGGGEGDGNGDGDGSGNGDGNGGGNGDASGSGNPGGTNPNPILASHIQLSADSRIIAPGQSILLRANLLPADVSDRSLSWRSSAPRVATVDKDGRVTGLSEGQTEIRAISRDGSGVFGQFMLTVAKPVTKLRTPIKTLYMKTGSSLTLPVVADSKGSLKAKLTWKSSNPKIASVSAAGKVKALKKGKAVITVTTLNGKSLRVTVKVVPKAKSLKKVGLSGLPAKLKKGRAAQIRVKLTPAEATGLTVKFRSSKTSVLSVDGAGRVTAKKKGSATITVTVGKLKLKRTIRVL